jgi:hypothetical protein
VDDEEEEEQVVVASVVAAAIAPCRRGRGKGWARDRRPRLTARAFDGAARHLRIVPR